MAITKYYAGKVSCSCNFINVVNELDDTEPVEDDHQDGDQLSASNITFDPNLPGSHSVSYKWMPWIRDLGGGNTWSMHF